ncbi:hypothetical protein AGMMS49960_17740 [Betaproteobacteria bacterium]|nr:hypothetical protein AGMMS49543_01110 [Betaproteobacteria bacterium]GHU03409.1 hypothetical protein AGMMS49960_17740 [Betaproteobacteria bacterium]GHU20334.1 hypothetical protein AGMMS50243_14670 [Betaproteobacteria bacterium]
MATQAPAHSVPAGTPLTIDAAHYLGVSPIRHVKPEWRIIVAERAFRPNPENPQADWLPTVVVPALKLIVEDRGPVKSFASIGAGAGVDILTGIEILGATVVGATDVFPDITEAAEWNIRQNLSNEHPVDVHVNHGDLLTPLQGRGLSFDVIYENLPNIPIDNANALEEKRKSSNFVPPRTEKIPQFAHDHLLALHYVALKQSLEFLSADGFVISTLGGRVPLEYLSRLAVESGLTPDFLSYSWKLQALGEEVLPSYAELETRGLGPFYYYPVEALEKTFNGISTRDSGVRAIEIEKELLPYRITATQAWQAYQAGQRIGHTVAVLKSARR